MGHLVQSSHPQTVSAVWERDETNDLLKSGLAKARPARPATPHLVSQIVACAVYILVHAVGGTAAKIMKHGAFICCNVIGVIASPIEILTFCILSANL